MTEWAFPTLLSCNDRHLARGRNSRDLIWDTQNGQVIHFLIVIQPRTWLTARANGWGLGVGVDQPPVFSEESGRGRGVRIEKGSGKGGLIPTQGEDWGVKGGSWLREGRRLRRRWVRPASEVHLQSFPKSDWEVGCVISPRSAATILTASCLMPNRRQATRASMPQ